MRKLPSLLSLAALSLSAQQPAPHPFIAQWITDSAAPQHDPAVLHFRKQLTLATVPAHFVVHVSADNQFLLTVNGHRIGSGPSIGDVQHWRYETYDLAPALHPGSNELAATVWNLGDLAPIRQITSHLGFLVDPDTPAEAAVTTNPTWEVRQDHDYIFLPKPAILNGDYYVASPGERLDISLARHDAIAGSTSAAWHPATSVGGAVPRGVHSEENSWLLTPDTLPAMEFTPTSIGHLVRTSGLAAPSPFPATPLEIPAHTTATLLLDRDTLTTAYPTLTVSGGAGAEISLRYAEALVDARGNKGDRNVLAGKHIRGLEDQFVPGGGDHSTFTPLDWRTWRFLELTVTTTDAPLRLDALTASFTAFPFEHRARFASDDPALTQIWDVGWRTARVCAHDAYMDTPFWERLQYVGDTRIQTLISYTNAGDDRLARQAITAFHDSLTPEGIGQSRYPSRHLQVIQNFSLLWITMVHDFWYYRDDPAFVRAQLPGIRTELDYFRHHLSPDGLPAFTDWWPFVDWADGFPGGNSPASPTGVSAADSLFYLQALRHAAEMEETLGDPTLAAEDHAEAERLAATIHAQFWSDDQQLLADTPAQQHFSQQANALAVLLDVVPSAQQAGLMNRILAATDHGFSAPRPLPPGFSVASNYFRFYLGRALVHAGLGDRYLETLAPWRTMLAMGLTTWAEQPEPTRSDSHAWAAHPNIDLLTTVAGITPAAPNFAAVEITPHLGPLHTLDVTYPAPAGDLRVSYRVGGKGGSTAKITLPGSLSGSLHWRKETYPLHPGPNTLQLP